MRSGDRRHLSPRASDERNRRVHSTITMNMPRSLRLLLPVCLALLAACGGSSAVYGPVAGSPSPTAVTVNATSSLAFSPSPTNIALGGTVTFAFGPVAHNVFFDAAPGVPADIPGANADTSAARTFGTTGNYVYRCHIHPQMKGTIVVASSTSSSDGG